MGFINKIFGKSEQENNNRPDIRFGRYSDSYKSVAQYDAWDKALEKFDQKNYLEAYRDFFFYLRDESEDNVKVSEEKGILYFEILQGSKKISGHVDHLKIRAEAKIVQVEKLHVDFMNRLISRNFNLEYSRYALDDENCIVIIFDSLLLDGSPYKFYFALKELAINADKQDDLLLDEFGDLLPIASNHLKPLPKKEKEAKYQFVITKIKQSLALMDSDHLKAEAYPGGVTYFLLDLVYKLDFLIKPEGFMMETLERINRQYFANDHKSISEKNEMIRRELEQLIDRPKASFFKEMYRIRTTFGITKPINYQRICGIIEAELAHMDWYDKNGFHQIALAIPGYIVGHSLFNYSVPQVIKALFRMYYEVLESTYFRNLGFGNTYADPVTQVLNAKNIKKGILNIVQQSKAEGNAIKLNLKILDCSSRIRFAHSFLVMVKELKRNN